MGYSKFFFGIFLSAAIILLCPAAAIVDRTLFADGTPAPAAVPVTGSESAANFRGCVGSPVPVVNAQYEQKVIEQTNQIRQENGLPPLKQVDGLENVARYHAEDMSVDDYFSHNTYDRTNGKLKEICDTWARMENYYTDWLAMGENIAAGQNSPAMAMDGWMHSKEHRQNILSKQYWEIGAGYYYGGGTYQYYWDQNFGRREGVYPLVIAGEKAQVDSQVVSVYIYGDWKEMRLRNDNGAWTNWQPFNNQFNWTLPNQGGNHTVTAQLRNGTSQTTTSDDVEFVKPSASATPFTFQYQDLRSILVH